MSIPETARCKMASNHWGYLAIGYDLLQNRGLSCKLTSARHFVHQVLQFIYTRRYLLKGRPDIYSFAVFSISVVVQDVVIHSTVFNSVPGYVGVDHEVFQADALLADDADAVPCRVVVFVTCSHDIESRAKEAGKNMNPGRLERLLIV